MSDDLSSARVAAARATILELLAPILEFSGHSIDRIGDDTHLLLDGVLDSYGFLQLILDLEGQLGAPMDFAGKAPAEFGTLGGLVRLIAGPGGTTARTASVGVAGERVTPAMLAEALGAVGVAPGDHLIVHSSLEALGWPEDGVGMYLDSLQAILGPEGTIAVPTFTFSFCRDQVYDGAATPSTDMGVFSELVRQHPDARRTRHPIQSMALLGRHAGTLAALDSPSAYGPGSAWACLPELGFKLLLLGASAHWASFIHHCEERAAVPYRAWKTFSGAVSFEEGHRENRDFQMYVRRLEADPELRAEWVRDRLLETGGWLETTLNHGQLATCRLTDYRDAAGAMLRDDPYALLANRDAVARAIAPTDSAA